MGKSILRTSLLDSGRNSECVERLLSVRLLPGTHILKAEFAKLNKDRLYLNKDRLLVGRRKLHPA